MQAVTFHVGQTAIGGSRVYDRYFFPEIEGEAGAYPAKNSSKEENIMSMRIGEDFRNNSMAGVPEKNNQAPGERPEKPETCTGNTDRVDAEIKKLRQEKEQLMKQLREVSGNEKQEAELKQKITEIDVELRMKDNDTYRRQNMEVHMTE